MYFGDITRLKLAQMHVIDTRTVAKRLLAIGIIHAGKLSDVDIRRYFDTYGWPDKLKHLKES